MNWDSSPSQSPSRPQRIRKRNRLLYYGDDAVENEDEGPSRRKATMVGSQSKISRTLLDSAENKATPGPSSQLSAVTNTSDRTVAKRIGLRLKNLLKLPKAHKMCVYEWFYSHIDRSLFEGDNDFMMCLKESFMELPVKTSLTRAHWSKIRRIMGKPRRCSEAFFLEERNSLKSKRMKIRLLQQRKNNSDDRMSFTDLPKEVPMSLVLGTKVTARLRGSHDGLFTGRIDAIDQSNSSYRVTFDRASLETQEVPDIEVASDDPRETMQLSSLTEQKRMFPVFSNKSDYDSLQSPTNNNDPVLGQSPLRSKLPGGAGGTLGGFPIQFLVQVARLSKILIIKKENLKLLEQMNSQAEKYHSYGENLPIEFQRKYATIVLDLERLNKDLNALLVGIQQYCLELSPENTITCDQVSNIRQQALLSAEQMVESKNLTSSSKNAVQNCGLTTLVVQLIGIMMQIKYLKENHTNAYEFKAISDSLNNIKKKIMSENMESFENNVEIHIAHVQSGMNQSLQW